MSNTLTEVTGSFPLPPPSYGWWSPERRRLRLALISTTAMMAGASAPSPFYPVIQTEFGFAPVMITVVFAAYAVALLAALLTVGALSDHVGRRPMVSAAFVVLALSMILFWQANGAAALIGSRVVQGMASGVLLSTLSATVVDLQVPDKPGSASAWNSISSMSGLALGGLISGAALYVVPDGHAATVVFSGLTGAYLLLAVIIWTNPETSGRRLGAWASLVPRVSLPREIRKVFAFSTPAFIAGWATGGLYLSLGSSIIGNQFHWGSPLGGGLAVTALAGSGAVAGFFMRKRSSRMATLFGTSALAVGSSLALAALVIGSPGLYFLAVAVTGTGFGTTFPGALRAVLAVVRPGTNAEVMAAVYVVCYLSLGIPVIIAGLLVSQVGLFAAACCYGIFVVALAVTAALLRSFGAQC